MTFTIGELHLQIEIVKILIEVSLWQIQDNNYVYFIAKCAHYHAHL